MLKKVEKFACFENEAPPKLAQEVLLGPQARLSADYLSEQVAPFILWFLSEINVKWVCFKASVF